MPISQQIAQMVDILPDADQALAFELVKKLVLAWDPDFTKVTPEEAKKIENAENSWYVDADEIDWESIGID